MRARRRSTPGSPRRPPTAACSTSTWACRGGWRVARPEAGGAAAPEISRPAGQEPRADGPWPAGNALDESPALWLRYDGSPAALPVRVVAHPRSIAHETSLLVQLGRRGLDGR